MPGEQLGQRFEGLSPVRGYGEPDRHRSGRALASPGDRHDLGGVETGRLVVLLQPAPYQHHCIVYHEARALREGVRKDDHVERPCRILEGEGGHRLAALRPEQTCVLDDSPHADIGSRFCQLGRGLGPNCLEVIRVVTNRVTAEIES